MSITDVRAEQRRDSARRASADAVREQQLDDLRVVLRLPAGRRVMWRVLHDTNYDVPCSNQHFGAMSAEVGKRDFALTLAERLRAASRDEFLKMLDENMQ